jgi:hypothetical protein
MIATKWRVLGDSIVDWICDYMLAILITSLQMLFQQIVVIYILVILGYAIWMKALPA